MEQWPYIPDAHRETADWLAWKRHRIGGNDAATLLGVNPHQNIQQLYDRIVHGITIERTKDELDFLSWRLAQEPLIARRYSENTGRKLRRTKSAYCQANPRVISSVDDEIVGEDKGPGILEMKSRDPMVWRKIKMMGAPASTFAQTQHYLMVTRRSWGAICEANLSNGKQIIADMDADPEFHAMLYNRIVEFLDQCDAGKRPDEETAEPVRMPAVGGELVTIEQMNEPMVAEYKELAAALEQARSIYADAGDFHELVKETFCRWMDRHGIDVVEGMGVRVYYKEQAGRKTFDKVAFRRAHPDIDLSQFDKQGAPFRTFRVYKRPLMIEG